jgi:ATP-dependent protease ClpP protease subunit
VLDDADFAPNPERAIWIDGEITKAMERRLRPRILELTAGSRAPITVFINSRGGHLGVGHRILDLLRSTDQDGESPCKLLTVAGSTAKSMAADILSAGDFAIADPGSRLLYHESRISLPQDLTADYASALGELLKICNRIAAASFLDKLPRRLLFLVSALRPEVEAQRAHANDRTLTDLDCFQAVLFQKVSPAAQQVLIRASFNWNLRRGLVTHFEEELAKVRLSSEPADIERIMLDTATAYEYESNGTDREWSLRKRGLRNISEHFFFLDTYFRETNGSQFATLCELWAHRILAKDDLDALSAEEKAEKFRAFFSPFWSFFVAIRRALHQAENNELTAMDALFLGLIDTVQACWTAERVS